MHPFEQTVSIVGPIAGAIAVLALFFHFLGWATRRTTSRAARFVVKGVFGGDTRVTVHLTSGNALENVRILGVTEPLSEKEAFPYEFRQMVILERPDGQRTLVRAKMILRIEVPPQPQ
jgi:hypothetical protein